MVTYNIIPCGTPVISKINPEVIGIITCAYIRYETIYYEVSYYNGLTYTNITLHESEFLITDKCKTKNKVIQGFKTTKTTKDE